MHLDSFQTVSASFLVGNTKLAMLFFWKYQLRKIHIVSCSFDLTIGQSLQFPSFPLTFQRSPTREASRTGKTWGCFEVSAKLQNTKGKLVKDLKLKKTKKMWMQCVHLVLHWSYFCQHFPRPCRICSLSSLLACQRDSLLRCYSAVCKPQWPKTWDRSPWSHHIYIQWYPIFGPIWKLNFAKMVLVFKGDWHWNSISSKHYGDSSKLETHKVHEMWGMSEIYLKGPWMLTNPLRLCQLSPRHRFFQWPKSEHEMRRVHPPRSLGDFCSWRSNEGKVSG